MTDPADFSEARLIVAAKLEKMRAEAKKKADSWRRIAADFPSTAVASLKEAAEFDGMVADLDLIEKGVNDQT